MDLSLPIRSSRDLTIVDIIIVSLLLTQEWKIRAIVASINNAEQEVAGFRDFIFVLTGKRFLCILISLIKISAFSFC
jgi:hypothetical protein